MPPWWRLVIEGGTLPDLVMNGWEGNVSPQRLPAKLCARLTPTVVKLIPAAIIKNSTDWPLKLPIIHQLHLFHWLLQRMPLLVPLLAQSGMEYKENQRCSGRYWQPFLQQQIVAPLWRNTSSSWQEQKCSHLPPNLKQWRSTTNAVRSTEAQQRARILLSAVARRH